MTTTEFSVFCPGVLEVLSIGKGDLRLSVGDNDDDREQARALIEEMLRKGYSIFVETDTGPERVTSFNPKRMTYTVAGPPVDMIAPPEAPEKATPTKAGTKPKKRRGRQVPVSGSRATAVGRTAGG